MICGSLPFIRSRVPMHHPVRDIGDEIRTVTFTTPGFEDVAAAAALGQSPVDNLVSAEPVVLLRHPGHGPLARQRQLSSTGSAAGRIAGGAVGK